MYNMKKILRKKSNFLIILILSFLLLCLLFLFKYLFVVQKDIELQIFDKHKNREIIIYEIKENVVKKVQSLSDILYIYSDYQVLYIENEQFGKLVINPYLIDEMPIILKGEYPTTPNEILLPDYTFVMGKKINLTEYVNKKISFILNSEVEINFIVAGIFDSNDKDFATYYNLKFIEQLLEKTAYNYTGNTRILINHYKNLDKVINDIGFTGELYDISGLEEIEVYKSLYHLVILLVSIIIFFVTLIVVVVSSILYHDTKHERFMQFALGYDNHRIATNYINYYSKMLIFSFVISIIGYIIGMFLYKKCIFIDNLILNDLFKMSLDFTFVIPIFVIFILMLTLLYLLIRFKLSKQNLINDKIN